MEAFEVKVEDLKIDPVLVAANLPRTEDDITLFEAALDADGGIRDPLVVWDRDGDGTLTIVDGMNRREYAVKRKIERLKVVVKDFDSIEAATFWIRLNQDARRNLTSDQRAYFIGALLDSIKSDGDLISFLETFQRWDLVEEYGETRGKQETYYREYVAKAYNIAPRTATNYHQYFRGLRRVEMDNPELARMILQGRITVNQNTVSKCKDIGPDVKLATVADIFVAVSVEPAPAMGRQQVRKEIKSTLQKFESNPSDETFDQVLKILQSYLAQYGNSGSEIRKTVELPVAQARVA